jgi:hypothetical protein
LIQNQDEETFKWLYKQFEKAFSKPKVIFTDGDQAMAAAITTQWPGTLHLLCTFHLWKNFYTHFRNSSTTTEGWNQISTLWWRLCKYTDDEFRDQFYDKWSVFCQLVETECSPDVYERNKTWLHEMHSKCHQWAACYTWQHTTYGIHSTSRAEAMNSSVSFFCSKHSLVSDLVKDLEDMSENQHQKSFTKMIREKLGSTLGFGYGFNVRKSVANWAMQYTSYAKRIILSQWALTSNYNIRDPEDGGEYYLVTYSQVVVEVPSAGKKLELDLGMIETKYTRKTSLNHCSCQFPSNYGLPCRHQWKLFFRLANSNTPDVEILSQFRIDKLWKVSQETLVHNLCDNSCQ